MRELTKIKKTSYHFFANISSIPEDTRKKYLQKILRRKNAGKQKNVKLIKIIFDLIEKDKQNEWDDDKICKKLDITKNMLYWHKSILLEDLRDFYFNWKEIETKEFNPANFRDSDIVSYEKAKKMYAIGMRMEAKTILLKLAAVYERKINLQRKPKPDNEKLMILVDIYGYLMRYYFGCRNTIKFNLYWGKLKKSVELNKKNLSRKENAYAAMIYLTSQSLKTIFRTSDAANYREAINRLYAAFKHAESQKAYENLFFITILIDDINLRLRNENHSVVQGYIEKAYNIAVERNIEIEIITFKAILVCFRHEVLKPKAYQSYLNEINECYQKAKKITPRSSYFTVIERAMLRMLSHHGTEEEFLEIVKSSYHSNIIESSSFEAWWRLYAYQNLKLDRHSFTWKFHKLHNTSIDFPIIDEINIASMRKLNELATNALNDYKNIFSFYVYAGIYQTIVTAEFFTEDRGNYKRAMLFIKRIENMEKTRPLPGKKYVELIKLGIFVIEDAVYKNEEHLREKYQNQLEELLNYFLETAQGSNLIDRYSVLVRIAQQSNVKFLWELVENYYTKLKNVIPEIIEKINKEILTKKIC